MTRRRSLSLVLLVVAMLAIGAGVKFGRYAVLLGPARPVPDLRIVYGPGDYAHADLWRPAGPGPYPVALMIHGGCWRSPLKATSVMNPIAADLRKRGVAVWNIEYRGIDRPDGGWPGTYEDVAAGARALAQASARYRLDTRRVVIVGHSAGGQLALWLAARGILPAKAVIGLASPTDLEGGRDALARICGADVPPRLTGLPSPERPDPYADTSPIRLAMPPIPITLITGAEDEAVPPRWAEAYAHHAPATVVMIPREGHIDPLLPASASWAAAVRAIERGLSAPAPPRTL